MYVYLGINTPNYRRNHQSPNSKFQSNFKHQTPITKPVWVLVIGDWSLNGVWNLVFGYSVHSSHRCGFTLESSSALRVVGADMGFTRDQLLQFLLPRREQHRLLQRDLAGLE